MNGYVEEAAFYRGALLLGLISAVLGAFVGVSRRQRAWAEGEVATRPPVVGERGVVYP